MPAQHAFTSPARAIANICLSPPGIGRPVRTLLLGSPPDIDGEAVIAAICSVGGVAGVHHVHLWQMQEHEAALDCHVVLTGDGWTRIEAIKQDIKTLLQDRFGIAHSTLEFESGNHRHEDAKLYCH